MSDWVTAEWMASQTKVLKLYQHCYHSDWLLIIFQPIRIFFFFFVFTTTQLVILPSLLRYSKIITTYLLHIRYNKH